MARRLVAARIVCVFREPAECLGLDRHRQVRPACLRLPCSEGQSDRQAERAVGVHAVPDRIRGLGQPVQEAFGQRVGERRDRGQPAARLGITEAGDLVHQRERPGPAVWPLVPPVDAGHEAGLHRQLLRGELGVQQLPDLADRHRVPSQPQQPHEQPVHLNAGVPVQAAVEHRRPLGGPSREVTRPRHQVDKERGELPADVGDRYLGVGGRLLVQDAQALRRDRTGRADLAVTHASSLRAPIRRTAPSCACYPAAPTARSGRALQIHQAIIDLVSGQGDVAAQHDARPGVQEAPLARRPSDPSTVNQCC